jgi:regulator of PEP synthase PpsR (kinase-PPPase family)
MTGSGNGLRLRRKTESILESPVSEQTPSRAVYVVSDSTGLTAEKVTLAAMMQFAETEVRVRKFPNVRTESALRVVLESAREQQALVVHTIGMRTLRDLANYESERLGLHSLDLLGPILTKLSTYLGRTPYNLPGLLHQLNEDYFQRVDAVEFAVRHDDGAGLETIAGADLIIAGVSRTSKTPLSMYLAHLGHRVANVPIVPGIPPPQELLQAPKNKVFALLIRPDALLRIREERLRKLGVQKKTSYVEVDAVKDELTDARRLFMQQGWKIIDVSGKAVEEVATEIMAHLGMHGTT